MPKWNVNNHNQRAARARRIAYLLSGFIRGTLTSPENDELDEWVGASEKNMELFEELTNEVNIKKGLGWMNENIPLVLKDADTELEYRIPRKLIKEYIYKASFFLVVIFFSAIFFNKSFHLKTPGTGHPLTSQNEPEPPGYGDKAVLTLSDGQVIILNQVGDGELAVQGPMTIAKENGLVKYSSVLVTRPEKIQYNTISTPRGGSCTLSLSDGSKVWLNAASSISYPVVFGEDDKKISITGEVYFEIPPNVSPINITINDKCGVRTGETFSKLNINAYEDNGEITITNLKGISTVITRKQSKVLAAMQQANISGSKITIDSLNKVRPVTAWKRGVIDFQNKNLELILKTVSRQYDIEISYDVKTEISFSCVLPAKGDINTILTALRNSANLICVLEGKKLKVSSL